MPNKATHQLTFTDQRDDLNDRFYIVRSSTDYQLPGYLLPPRIEIASRLIITSEVLALFTTPLQIVPAAPVGWVHIPLRGLVEFTGGTADYATNTQLYIGSTSAMAELVVGSIADRTDPNALTTANGAGGVPSVAGDSLSVSVGTGNPTAGDSDIRVTVWYYTLEL
jgi:hypothetical protein